METPEHSKFPCDGKHSNLFAMIKMNGFSQVSISDGGEFDLVLVGVKSSRKGVSDPGCQAERLSNQKNT